MCVPTIVNGREGPTYLWRVGECSVSASPSPARGGWVARVHRPDWGGDRLTLDGHFATQDQALAWCAKIATVLAQDLADDQRSF
jgi:hypothetical protein